MSAGWTVTMVGLVALGSAAGPAPAEAEGDAEVAPASTEVVRIKRDFGKPHFDLAIDAWKDGAARLGEVRLRWVNTSEGDRRKPLGRLIERMVSLQYRRLSSKSLSVVVAGDGKEFTFTVVLDKDGIHTFVAVDTEDGRFIPRCRTDSALLLARRVLSIPVGISRVAVTCRDSDGSAHKGQVRHRDL